MQKLVSVCLVAAFLTLSGCASNMAQSPNGPPSYRAGFAGGCDSGYNAAGNPYYRFTKDPMQYASDQMYAQGWNDGFANCQGRYNSLGR